VHGPDPLRDATWTLLATPLGQVRLTAVEGVLCGVYWSDHRPAPPQELFGRRDPAGPAGAVAQLTAYFRGELQTLDLPYRDSGSPFHRSVRQVLRDIPYGRTLTYGEVARKVGRPGAARAVGTACGRNPLALVIPCHRVIGADGRLTGYNGGTQRKEWLLRREGALRPG
jgi:methylated-DNA-[protein]-cysteine S-methyltransferase